MRWIASRPPAEAAKLLADRERGERLRAEFRRIVRSGKAALATAYASDVDVEAKRRAKREAFESMRTAYLEAKGAEPGLAAFDRWFAGEGGAGPNNASLVSMGLYSDNVAAFRVLLAREDGNLPRFYARVRELATMPKLERHAVLAALASPTIAGARAEAPKAPGPAPAVD